MFNLSFMCKKPSLVIAYFHENLYYYYQREGSLAHIIPHNQRIKVSRYFMTHYDETNGVQAKDILLHEVIRNVSAYRYLQMFVPDQTEVKATCRELYTFCRKRWNGIFFTEGKSEVFDFLSFPVCVPPFPYHNRSYDVGLGTC